MRIPANGTCALAVLTRLPTPGLTKTRLIPALGADGAARLQRDMTAHTLRQACLLGAAGAAAVTVWYSGGSESDARAAFGRAFTLRRQPEGDLGLRIGSALRTALDAGADRAIVIGTDCPDLGASAIRAAFETLSWAPVVLGPATDGGYYLMGVRGDAERCAVDAAMAGIPWGTADVLEKTVSALASQGIVPTLLPALSDVDEPRDLKHWAGATVAPSRISVVVPSLNEAGGIAATVRSASGSGAEVIVADGGSVDGTQDIARWAGARVIEAPLGRARQLNAGASEASGDVLLFLHADTVLPSGFAARALDTLADPAVALGAFAFSTDLATPTMRLFERGTNWRARRLGMPYGDQALFVRADSFRALGGFPDLPVMEDYEFVRRARRCGRVAIASEKVVTSGRAWLEHGVWFRMLANAATVVAYRLGVAPATIARWRGGRRGDGTDRAA